MNALVSERSRVVTRPDPGPCPIIETKRLRLRPHRLSDAASIAQSLADFQVARMLARVPAPYHQQDALDWLNRQTASVLPDWTLAVTSGDDVHIGCVGIELRHGEWHVGYWLNRFYWGKGLASEAVHGAVERFFRRMPETVLHSGVFADNPASLKVQEKLGFRVTGCSQIYALARNAMVAHIETRLTAEDLRRPA
ncbi:GNAT family N-acetyltransferase [Sinorhizobium americanum]|uniref:Acetyltransferase n=1 Tax=Sinorhizobium americanum TaxID=194963 RepID=A0A1L3LRS3_9HYPH|nr:GNAT family N-acetyltransferase [Sinorhizobium americanum]APG86148.1 acetyltransferase [Sinorhizobium americanum CCGM7]APG92788.1 acetyltransferase [Sinorhizobium americanum]OAP47839.1 acetyltransferase [Sinorhizobium americanum]TCN31940.1 RimJ/RimL family protein N-acetyltransferase [Sinorhizobium americanum]